MLGLGLYTHMFLVNYVYFDRVANRGLYPCIDIINRTGIKIILPSGYGKHTFKALWILFVYQKWTCSIAQMT